MSRTFRFATRRAALGLAVPLIAIVGLLPSPLPADDKPVATDVATVAFLERFKPKWHHTWYIAEYDMPQASFTTSWRRKAVQKLKDGPLRLTLKPRLNKSMNTRATKSVEPNKKSPDSDAKADKKTDKKTNKVANKKQQTPKPYIGAEVQRKAKVHFGRYEVVMTAARGNGIISSFFTYTGGYFGTPHEEIDFEFLGHDTTNVELNMFKKGKSTSLRRVKLGFDAADAPHLYAFEWQPDGIVWYVDGREVYRIEGREKALPVLPVKLMINLWAVAPGQAEWAGKPSPSITTQADYYCISYRPTGSNAAQCSDSYTPPPATPPQAPAREVPAH